jgi:hypothetical protein
MLGIHFNFFGIRAPRDPTKKLKRILGGWNHALQMSKLIVLLGCHVALLLNGRIQSAVEFASSVKDANVVWFLSGGIKNPLEDTQTEAAKMAAILTGFDASRNNTNSTWSYVHDTVATNTAENFVMLDKMIDDSEPSRYSDIYVVTSEFHYKRASAIANGIIEGNTFQWILSDVELHDSRYWETIHMKNVKADVERALERYHTFHFNI